MTLRIQSPVNRTTLLFKLQQCKPATMQSRQQSHNQLVRKQLKAAARRLCKSKKIIKQCRGSFGGCSGGVGLRTLLKNHPLLTQNNVCGPGGCHFGMNINQQNVFTSGLNNSYGMWRLWSLPEIAGQSNLPYLADKKNLLLKCDSENRLLSFWLLKY